MKKTVVVGICGGSASGKTTFCETLECLLTGFSVKAFHLDNYFRPKNERQKITGLTNGMEYIDDNHPSCLNFDAFHNDWDRALSEELDVVLVEGLFAFWDEKILPQMDLKVYVDCDPDERFMRRIRRNLSYGQELDEITERYVQAVQPRFRELVEPTKWKADVILNGFTSPAVGNELIASWVREQVRKNNE